MLGWKSDKDKRANCIAARVDMVRKARASQGHELSVWAVAMVSQFAEIDPKCESHYAEEFSKITRAVLENGIWRESEEWRIMTWFDSAIERKSLDGKDWYFVKVECDGQTLSCRCPTIEKAFGFTKLYQRLIIDQFYSVGPPWADNRIFEP